MSAAFTASLSGEPNVIVSRWSERGDVSRGHSYDDRWRDLEAAGGSIHGEADLIAWFEPGSVLDAGCGTGRVAIELDRRGVDVTGVDLDPQMLEAAHEKAPHIRWIEGDLVATTVDDADGARRTFDVVAMPGNVMIFVAPGSEDAVVANMAQHLRSGGRLIAGFQLGPRRLGLDAYDHFARAAGLTLEHRWSTWDREPFAGGDYAVSVHRALFR